ncbi:MAG: CesT family type III secretion system chaperone [Promethearchaeota archaeon]|jgi:hypothetical protein
MRDISVHATKEFDLLGFLAAQGFEVEVLTDNVFKITKDDDLPVFLSHNDGSLYFEVDVGSIDELLETLENNDDLGINLLTEFLDLNTEVLPVSFGINSTDPVDRRLVLVESRVTGDLNDQELLSVFDALSIAVDKAEKLLAEIL